MSSFNVGFVIFPDLTQLDFTGPLQVLSGLPESAIHIIAKSEAPVPSDCGLSLVPTRTFANCPPLDLICIPEGSQGVAGAIGDRETIAFVRQQAANAKYVTSVCTGAFGKPRIAVPLQYSNASETDGACEGSIVEIHRRATVISSGVAARPGCKTWPGFAARLKVGLRPPTRRRHQQIQTLRAWARASGFHQTKATASINRVYVAGAKLG
jgi:hypothetical protein